MKTKIIVILSIVLFYIMFRISSCYNENNISFDIKNQIKQIEDANFISKYKCYTLVPYKRFLLLFSDNCQNKEFKIYSFFNKLIIPNEFDYMKGDINLAFNECKKLNIIQFSNNSERVSIITNVFIKEKFKKYNFRESPRYELFYFHKKLDKFEIDSISKRHRTQLFHLKENWYYEEEYKYWTFKNIAERR